MSAWSAATAAKRHGSEQSRRWRGLEKVQHKDQHDQRGEEEGPVVEEEEQWCKLYYLAIHGESKEGRRGSEKEWESEGGLCA